MYVYKQCGKERRGMEYVLETNALGKRYGRSEVLSGLSMHVPKGSIYGFVGKNGAGKTTLIRLICGLQNPTAGEYILYGKSNRSGEMRQSRRRMGAMVETPSIYSYMSAEDNLKVQYRMLGLPSYEGIPELLNLVGLKDVGKKYVKNFSLGMRQRIGIAVALAGNPDFLVLDEPANGLDPEGIIEIRELILKLNRERQVTVLITSHILDELSRVATHYGFLDQGHIVKEVSTTELEQACRKCLRLKVSNIEAAVPIMDGRGWQYAVLQDQQVDVFEEIHVTELVLALAERDCEVISLQEREESLESYFINLIGGAEK